jgi:hypothetical protein
MENIVEPSETFDFSKLSLAHPVGIQGGAYFTKIEHNKKPLYIQTTKSQSRQGFVKTGKKYYIDLMFDKNAEHLIHWFENLESCCQKLIFEKRDTWFQNGLEESDIESAFNSTIRIYKSGKYYLLRSNIKNNHQNEPIVSIYNEQKLPVKMEDVTLETNFISILEIQGIKFTSRNFQIEIELKQMMILDNEPLFDNCIINTSYKTPEPVFHEPMVPTSSPVVKIDELPVEDSNKNDPLEEVEEVEEVEDLEEKNIEVFEKEVTLKPLEQTGEIISLDIEDIEEKQDLWNEVENLEFSLDPTFQDDVLGEHPLQLKKPNQVYFELYKEARKKAKQAKKNAIIAYLEAKNNKKTYMIENVMDSDSDFDAEIDEVSESELDDL